MSTNHHVVAEALDALADRHRHLARMARLAHARLAHALDTIDPGPDDDDVDRWAAHDRDMSVTDDEAEEFAADMRERNARRCVDCEARITTAGRNGTCADCALAQLEGVALADMEAS